MPLYDFKCESCEKTTSWFGSYSNRPASINCSTCDGKAKYTISISDHQANDSSAIAEKKSIQINQQNWSGVAWHEFICEKCGHDDLNPIDFKAGEDLSPRECSKCDGVMRVKLSANIDRFSEKFPYFDRGLGCWLKSKSHRRQVCRQRGLVAIYGDADFEKQASKQATIDDNNEKAWKKLEDKYENAPAFRNYREARDKGIIAT